MHLSLEKLLQSQEKIFKEIENSTKVKENTVQNGVRYNSQVILKYGKINLAEWK